VIKCDAIFFIVRVILNYICRSANYLEKVKFDWTVRFIMLHAVQDVKVVVNY
jgi:hypothetical protein